MKHDALTLFGSGAIVVLIGLLLLLLVSLIGNDLAHQECVALGFESGHVELLPDHRIVCSYPQLDVPLREVRPRVDREQVTPVPETGTSA